MEKRTQKQIEKDCKVLKEAAKTATNMKELERVTGLSYAMINTTLSKHPIVFNRIKKQLIENKEKAELEKQKQKEQEERARAEAEEKAKKEAEVKVEQADKSVTTPKLSGYVMDASITGIENLKEILSKICLTKAKIILTSVTVKELAQMQKFDDIDERDACYILALAAENNETFKSVLIDETLDTPDDCIVKYCADNKENVTLLTSDKEMALKARMHSVQVHYFKQTQAHKNAKTILHANTAIRTLIPARRIGNQLLISNLQRQNQSIRIISNGIEYSEGTKELKVGDDVFIATKKEEYSTFVHYHVISLYAENNCEQVYSKRFYNYDDLDLLEARYKSFMKDFKKRQGL